MAGKKNTPVDGDIGTDFKIADEVDNSRRSINESPDCDGDSDDNDGPRKRDDLNKTREWAYSVGHFNNDLCAAMWFVYLVYYVNEVVELSPTVSGLVLLSGQITDGITTPTVGYLSDKLNCPGGRRNFWYYFGFSFVNITFLGIFTDPQFFGTAPNINVTA